MRPMCSKANDAANKLTFERASKFGMSSFRCSSKSHKHVLPSMSALLVLSYILRA